MTLPWDIHRRRRSIFISSSIQKVFSPYILETGPISITKEFVLLSSRRRLEYRHSRTIFTQDGSSAILVVTFTARLRHKERFVRNLCFIYYLYLSRPPFAGGIRREIRRKDSPPRLRLYKYFIASRVTRSNIVCLLSDTAVIWSDARR